MNNAEKGIRAHFATIAQVFPRFDLPAFRRAFHLPCLITTPDGVFSVPDEAAFEGLFGGMMTSLREQGLTASDPETIHIHELGGNVALASVVWVRYKGDEVLERLGATYTLIREGDEWLVAAIILHGEADVIS